MTAVCERATLCLGMALAALAVALLVPGLARAGFAPDATVHTETTQYTYNADGALTAQRTTLDAGSAQGTYFTWDNFLPATADPSSGTVSAANGNLLGYGAAPGSTDSAAFTFDRRNRLTGYAGTGRQVAYAYTAGGLLAAATPAAGSGLRFYHDDAAQMTNLRQDAGASTELWSGDLGRVRTVGDGAEQVRLRPRKDVAGTYDAGAESVAAHQYDAYGAQSAAPSAQYDIHANPMQYAGEYRDALWGGSYLRARWYAPELPLFLSRDPVAHLGRYGYAGGNPVMRIDPSGRSWKSFENSFAHGRMGWQRWLQHLGGSNAWYSHVARLTAGMLLGPLQMVANPAGFVNAIVHDTGGMDFFLAAGVLSEGAAGYFGLRLTTITALQSVGGAGQSALAAVDRSFSHFNAGTFVTGLEYTAGAELDTFLPRLVRAARNRFGRTAAATTTEAAADESQYVSGTGTRTHSGGSGPRDIVPPANSLERGSDHGPEIEPAGDDSATSSELMEERTEFNGNRRTVAVEDDDRPIVPRKKRTYDTDSLSGSALEKRPERGGAREGYLYEFNNPVVVVDQTSADPEVPQQ